MSLLTISLLSLVELFGDAQFKFFARSGQQKYLAGGLVGYVGVVYFLIKALKSGNVMYVNGMWDGVSALLNTIGVYFLLGERLNTGGQYAGLVFIIGGVFLMARDGPAY
jgi:multidrug transporter EmrE-like cation transporter